MAYDKNTDYQALIDQAVAQGDYAVAARYEQQRNEKIADLNASGSNVYGAVASSSYAEWLEDAYTPLNASAAPDVNYGNYLNEVRNQQEYLSANPSAGQAMSEEEKNGKYGDIVDSTVPSGYYTRDYAAAKAAAEQYGVSVTPTSYNGEDGWYLVGRAQRDVQTGSSGADEGLLSDADYAIVQQLKSDYAAAQQGYMDAVAAGDTALAEQYRQAMDAAHLDAERIRAGYGYSGGTDGSLYITSGALDSGWEDETSDPIGYVGSTVPDSSTVLRDLSGLWDAEQIPVPSMADLSAGVQDYSAYLEQMYAAKKAAALAELQAAYEKNVAELNRAGEGLGAAYQTARRQTAGAAALAERNFHEYAAAGGLNSGTAGQAALARSVTLQNNLNAIDTDEAGAAADLQLARANAETEYNSAIAKAQADGDYELAQALYREKVRVQEALLELEIQEQQYALKQYQLRYQAQRDQISDRVKQYQLEYEAQRDGVSDSQWAQELALQQQKYAGDLALQQQKYADSLAQSRQEQADAQTQKRADALASYGEAYLKLGVLPSAEMLTAMGITEADAQRYIAAVQAGKK